jgi:N-acetylmuramoyl-L-alanine amidase
MGFVLLWIFAVVSLPLRGEDRKPLLPCIGCSSQGYNIANGWTEAVGTNEIKLQVISDLEEMGIPVLSAPYRNARTQKENDTYGLKERADYANEHKADIYIELHTDSARDFEGVTGTMGVYYDSDDKDLAQFFVERTARAMGLKERPLFLKKCYVLTKTTMPACIIEILNHSDPDDALLLKDTAWQKKYAGALAEAIKEYCTGGH